MKYQTKLVEIEAYEWLGGNEIIDWANNVSDGNGTRLIYTKHESGKESLLVDTLEGTMQATRGDFVICGLEGEFYFCKPQIFHKKYEPSEDALVEAAIQCANNFGAARDMYHPDYGQILKNGEITEVGLEFFKKAYHK